MAGLAGLFAARTRVVRGQTCIRMHHALTLTFTLRMIVYAMHMVSMGSTDAITGLKHARFGFQASK